MNRRIRVQLRVDQGQQSRLEALQQTFAKACNVIAAIVQETHCWNRVALHHMAYKLVRERFPELGSQMACNAIYSVSLTSRQVYQSPASPFNITKLEGRPLPLLQFTPQAPVYFDRHTLSLREGELSMYTLDGRIRFQLGLSARQQVRFREDRLREIVLTQQAGHFYLEFEFHAKSGADASGSGSPRHPEATEPELSHIVVMNPSTGRDAPSAQHP